MRQPMLCALLLVMGFLLGACHHPSAATLYPAPCVSTHACATAVTGADSTLPTGSLRGLVLAQEWVQTPLDGAQVFAASRPERLAYSDRAGMFRLAQLVPGEDTIVVRRVGYVPRRIPVVVPVSGGLWMVVPVQRSSVELR